MGALGAILGVLLIFVSGIAGIYGIAMGLFNGIIPLWEMVYTALWLQMPPKSADWLYFTVAELILVSVLVPIWTGICVLGLMIGAAIAGISN
jgi:hypothetical protein